MGRLVVNGIVVDDVRQIENMFFVIHGGTRAILPKTVGTEVSGRATRRLVCCGAENEDSEVVGATKERTESGTLNV